MSTDIATIEGRCEDKTSTFDNIKHLPARVHLTRFYGGITRGRMLQLTVQDSEGVSHVQLTEYQIIKLSQILNNSFNDHIYPSE